MKQWMILAAVLVVLVAGPGPAAAAPEKTADVPVTMTIVVAGDCERGEESIGIKPGQLFQVDLYASGGTGYAWTLVNTDFSLVELTGDSAGPVDPDSSRVGGRVKWSYYLKMKQDASGQEVIRFVLQRAWEKNVPPARAFDLTVVAR